MHRHVEEGHWRAHDKRAEQRLQRAGIRARLAIARVLDRKARQSSRGDGSHGERDIVEQVDGRSWRTRLGAGLAAFG